MNKTTRTLAMSGIAVAAGLTMGVGPASAAPGTTAAGSTTSAASTTSAGFGAASSSDHRWGNGRVVGYFRTASACVRMGKIGEFRHKWDDSDCDFVRRGFHRGQWQLTVSWDRHGRPFGQGNDNHGPKGGGHKDDHGPQGGHKDDDRGPKGGHKDGHDEHGTWKGNYKKN
ncbi:MAG TPA: hypothetical protein VGB74_08850 [Actinoplanes sp.]|jgi:hypothetical protein